MAVVTALLALPAYAQQAEIPAAPASGTVAEDPAAAANPERIVDGRPDLYGVKRYAHPVSWFEAGVSSLLKTFEKAIPPRKMAQPTPATNGPPKPSGFKIDLKSMGPGSGFGPEVTPFAENLFGTGIRVQAPLTVTYNLYHFVGIRANYPLASQGGLDRVGLDTTASYSSRPSENFYGIGNDSLESEQTEFRAVNRAVTLALDARLPGQWTTRLEGAYRSVGITKPRNFLSVPEVFPDTPGLTGGIMMSTTFILERHSKDRPYLPTSGGFRRIDVTLNDSLEGGDFSYWRYHGEFEQFFPLSKDRRKVMSLRAQIATLQAKNGNTVPFFDMPIIGSYTTVRGFDSRRFTDTSAMAVSLGYRYRIWRYLDWGLFVDSGQVGDEIGDFGWKSFHTGYGIRLIGNAQGRRAIALDVAFSDERKWMFYLNFTPAF